MATGLFCYLPKELDHSFIAPSPSPSPLRARGGGGLVATGGDERLPGFTRDSPTRTTAGILGDVHADKLARVEPVQDLGLVDA